MIFDLVGFGLWLFDFVLVAHGRLDHPRRMFHFCSHGSRNAWRGAQPWLEGAYALRQRLSPGNEIHAALRLSQAA
jgi:hypothetical protein